MCTEAISSMYERYWPSFGDWGTKENSKLRLFLTVIPLIGIPVFMSTINKYGNLRSKGITVTRIDLMSYAKYIVPNLALTGVLLISLYATGVFASLAFPVSGAFFLGWSLFFAVVIMTEPNRKQNDSRP